MKSIYVDDELWMIRRFEMESAKIDNIDLVETFHNPLDAIEYVKSHEVNCAFLDVDMAKMSGLELSDHLRKISPKIIIIYISAHTQFMPDAFKHKGADYYLLKPYSGEELKDVADRAKLLMARQKKRLYIETFGNFNVYIDGEFVNFSSKIAKEILALLVDRRGTAMTNKEAFFCIWEDLPCTHENMTRIRKGMQKLRSTLEEAGIRELLISNGSDHRVDVTKFDCDYYDFMDSDPEALKKYQGKYMTEYSWAEETNAILNEIYLERKGNNI